MIITKEQQASLKEASKPLADWLMVNCHPHVTAIVTNGDTELLEGLAHVLHNPEGVLEGASS